MLLGKMLRGLTGTPMRRIALANSSLALAEPEPFTLANLMTKSLTASMLFMPATSCRRSRHTGPAGVILNRNFCMSQAPVGQRSAHRPQCRHTSSSFTITLPVFRPPDTYRSCARLSAGAFRRVRRSSSVPFSVKLMQSIGQMSTQASHSMQAGSVKTVCTSQFRHRPASFTAVATSKPSSTSTLMLASAFSALAHGTL